MSAITAAEAGRLDASHADVLKAHRRQYLWPVGLVVMVVVYLTYAFFSFDIPALIAKSRLDRGVLLGLDSVAYKVHVEKNLRRGAFEVAVEGERTATYAPDALPDWVRLQGANPQTGRVDVEMGGGYRFAIEGESLTVTGPGLRAPFTVTAGGKTLSWEGPVPAWIELNEKTVEIRPTQTSRASDASGRTFL